LDGEVLAARRPVVVTSQPAGSTASPRSTAELLAIDRSTVWHPYAPMPALSEPLLVRSAQGVRLTLADGREVIDGMSSWWAAIHGYRHPVLDAAVAEQLGQMSHVMFGGLTHEPAIALAERLVRLTPDPLRHVFFADSGSVSVEVALKMAVQYWRAAGQPRKTRMFTVRGGYHGDTFGAMSVCDPVGGMHHLFTEVLTRQVFADEPPAGFDASPDEEYVEALDRTIAAHARSLAAVVLEPVVQGAGGMRFYNPIYLRVLRDMCDAYGLLLICDEIATGFGRSGRMFASEHAGVSPDILCVGKALTGGYLTMAATLCTTTVANVISGGEGGAFMHGPTFMGNPLAAAVAGASIDLLLSRDWAAEVQRIEQVLTETLAPARALSGVADVRVLGGIGVIQTRAPVDVTVATTAALQAGVWIRPFRDLLYVMPPYVTGEDDLAAIGRALVAAAQAVAA
jgi:adenosylmethionine-8-amino-7-oxononanoate aminotransferase